MPGVLSVVVSSLAESVYHAGYSDADKTLCQLRRLKTLEHVRVEDGNILKIFGRTTDVAWCPKCAKRLGVQIAKEKANEPEPAKPAPVVKPAKPKPAKPKRVKAKPAPKAKAKKPRQAAIGRTVLKTETPAQPAAIVAKPWAVKLKAS